MSDLCPVCKKPFHIRRKRMLEGKKSNKLGRPKIRNDKEIKILRSTGLTIRDIAARIGLSTTAVQRGLK